VNVLRVDHIVATVGVGHIARAIREAIIMAMTENRVVKFEFNGKSIVVDPSRLLEHIGDQYHYDKSE
jgi:hypothetical protein